MPAFKDTFFNIFTIKKCKKAFKALELVLIDIAVVLNYLKVQLHTLPAPPLLKTPWQLKTLSNMLKFRLQLKLINNSFIKSPVIA